MLTVLFGRDSLQLENKRSLGEFFMVNGTSVGDYQKIVACYQDVGEILGKEESGEKLEDVASLEQRLMFACTVWGECFTSIDGMLQKRSTFPIGSVEHVVLTLETRNLYNTAEKVHKIVASYSTQLYIAQKKMNAGELGRIRRLIAHSFIWKGTVKIV